MPRPLRCPDCGRYLGRRIVPTGTMRVVASERDASPLADVVPCRNCGWVEVRPTWAVLRALRLVQSRDAA